MYYTIYISDKSKPPMAVLRRVATLQLMRQAKLPSPQGIRGERIIMLVNLFKAKSVATIMNNDVATTKEVTGIFTSNPKKRDIVNNVHDTLNKEGIDHILNVSVLTIEKEEAYIDDDIVLNSCVFTK